MTLKTRFDRSPDCNDVRDVVTSFLTSLDNDDELSITARSRLNSETVSHQRLQQQQQKPVDYIMLQTTLAAIAACLMENKKAVLSHGRRVTDYMPSSSCFRLSWSISSHYVRVLCLYRTLRNCKELLYNDVSVLLNVVQ